MASATPSRRALRRHHRDRVKKARASYWGGPFPEAGAVWESRRLGMLAQSPRHCSCCPFHVQPRAFYGNGTQARTVAEHREEAAAREVWAELTSWEPAPPELH